jgi:hypothetical protein
MRSDQFGSITSKNSSSSSLRDRRVGHRHQPFRLAQHQRAVLVNDDVAEDQLGVQQVQDLLDQRAEDRVVFVLDVVRVRICEDWWFSIWRYLFSVATVILASDDYKRKIACETFSAASFGYLKPVRRSMLKRTPSVVTTT